MGTGFYRNVLSVQSYSISSSYVRTVWKGIVLPEILIGLLAVDIECLLESQNRPSDQLRKKVHGNLMRMSAF